jgi:hypothetical protein
MQCPECDAPLPDDAVLCVDCGYILQTGKRLKTKIVRKERPPEISWDRTIRGGHPTTQIVVLLVLMAGMLLATPMVLLCVVSMIPSHHKWFGLLCIIPIVLVGWLVIVAASGSFTRIQLDRKKILDPRLILTSFFACIPIRKQTIHLLRYQAVYTDHRIVDRGRGMRYDQYMLYLGGAYINDKPLLCIFQGRSNALMGQLCDILAEVANIEVKRK